MSTTLLIVGSMVIGIALGALGVMALIGAAFNAKAGTIDDPDYRRGN